MAIIRSRVRGTGVRRSSPLLLGAGGALAGGGLALVAVAVALLLAGIPRGGVPGPDGGLERLGAVQQGAAPGERAGLADVGRLAAGIELFWRRQLSSAGLRYRAARFDVSEGPMPRRCGRHSPACNAADTVHIDARVVRALRARGASTGGPALQYVVAHAFARHVQLLLGVGGSPVARELQADCLAGVWAYSTRRSGVLEPGVMAAALATAAEAARDRFEGGSSTALSRPRLAERLTSFRRGYDTGRGSACRTQG